jgi:hypothetical protein
MNEEDEARRSTYFEGRELKSYAEPVSPNDLKEGMPYFTITFADREMLVPIMETLVFIGKNLQRNDVGQLYFQDVRSHRDGVRYSPGKKRQDSQFMVYPENNVKHVFEYERALDVLMRCALRCRKAGRYR